ncbi:Glutaredoxin domain-containing cysteine-rich protein 2 [Merluccius polli]|uniref:Glutaredoxin domain-containing cysteine-rich protein 2 n=1 Tax=Merluccius polli TaxID=89951 RepID=A0AA47P2E1_MERPO|nr:Glutaredoxin domain-containing cysteine-rich protein 2 [Merluccius polli]
MEEIQRKLTQRYEGAKQRKVRFKLASSYSGRVLKHVYEDGQEVDSPEEKYPHSFLHRKLPPSHLELDQLCGFQESAPEEGVYPPTGVIAQRINVYRGMGCYKPALSQGEGAEGDPNSSVLDFGKIIIYTSNLRIIRAPPQRTPDTPPQRTPDTPPQRTPDTPPPEDPRHAPPEDPRHAPPEDPRHTTETQRRPRGPPPQQEEEVQEISETASGCQQCGGSGRAACSLCHGSKLSMLATRFHESISDLRCQACYPHGLEACQACSAANSTSQGNQNRFNTSQCTVFLYC